MQPCTRNESFVSVVVAAEIANSGGSPESPGPQGKSTRGTKRRERTRKAHSEPLFRNKEQDVMQGAFPSRERVLGRRDLDLSDASDVYQSTDHERLQGGTHNVLLPR